jgi:hypothetical protein
VAKTSTQRSKALRQAREDAGIQRREVFAHDQDWPEIKGLAARRLRARLKPMEKK